MLSDHYSESRPHTSNDIHPNRRQHYHNIDPLANFAPWEDEEGVDYTSSHSLTLLGFKAVAGRPYTALTKGASFANPVDETEEFIQNTTSETIKKENRKEYRKQATVSEYNHKREQRQTSQRFSTDFETNNPTTPKILALASNNPSQRDNNTATPKPVAKVYRGIQRNNQQAYMKERHLSEQYLGLERAKSQEQDPSSIIQNKVNLPFNSLLDKAKSFTAKPAETSQIPGTIEQNNFYILDTNTGTGAIDPNISTTGSFILVQHEENNINAKKPKTASLSCRVSPKFAHNIEISKSKPTKLYIQHPVFLDTKVSTVENNETIEGIASPTEDAQTSKDDIKQKKVRGFKKEFVPMKLSTAVVSSKGLKIVNRTMSGNTHNKTQNLTNLIQLNNMTRIESDKKEDYTIDSDNQYTSFNSQSMRPATTKNSPAVKWFGKSYRGEDDIPGTTYVPSMLDCYKKNRKKYLRPSSNAIQEVPQKQQTTTFDDLYKISQIPLLGNLRKMLDNKGKSSSSISVRPKTIAISVSPPPERAKHFTSNTNIKIGDSILSDQDINQSNLRGKLEACLRQKMSNSGVIVGNKKKGDIFEERPMSKQDNGKKGTGKYPGHSPRKLKRPSAGMQMFMRSWK